EVGVEDNRHRDSVSNDLQVGRPAFLDHSGDNAGEISATQTKVLGVSGQGTSPHGATKDGGLRIDRVATTRQEQKAVLVEEGTVLGLTGLQIVLLDLGGRKRQDLGEVVLSEQSSQLRSVGAFRVLIAGGVENHLW